MLEGSMKNGDSWPSFERIPDTIAADIQRIEPVTRSAIQPHFDHPPQPVPVPSKQRLEPIGIAATR
jgi:hypothetical protein